MRRSITFFQQVHRVAARLAVGPDPLNPIHPTPELKRAWEEMRALCDRKENEEDKKLFESPEFKAEQKKIAERLGEILKAAERSNGLY